MSLFARLNPFRALADLRRFLRSRGRHEVVFLFAALFVCFLIVGGFFLSSRIIKPYQPPTIIYVQSWRADRTDAEIIAQQKIDLAKKKIDDAKLEKLKAEQRAAYKRLGDRLKPWL
jgi:hypothetical protein